MKVNQFAKKDFSDNPFFISPKTLVVIISYCIVVITTWNFHLNAQPLSFERYQNVHVVSDTAGMLLGAWHGGLNAPQFGQIDLDHNGQADLLVFDRAGNQILPYLYINNADECNGLLSEEHYCFAPEYKTLFPPLHDWVQLVNWDNIEPTDILTYGTAGINLYLGSYNLNSGQLQFQLASDVLRYEGLNGPLNIAANTADRPAFADVNADGDIDVLNFDFSGAFVEYFENQSQELTGTPADTIWFLRQTKCWGHFKEDANSSQILLNELCAELLPEQNADSASLFSPKPPPQAHLNKQKKQPILHAGSTLLAWDIDNDQDQELFVGDVSSRHLTLLYNGGNTTSAQITAAFMPFPAYDVPANLYRFLTPMRVDIDNDNLPDLLVTPNYIELQSKDQVWYYRNVGTADEAIFALQTKHFLEANMIDVGVNSYPALADYDGDGLLDLFVGNYGYLDTTTLQHQATLALFRNTGTASAPAFALVSTDFAQLSQYQLPGIYPAFADMDGDGDTDMISGDNDGFLHYFRNTAPNGAPMALEMAQAAFVQAGETGTAIPCLWPIMGTQNQYDIIVGEKAGKLSLWQNISTSPDSVKVQLANSFWGQVDVRTIGIPFGYSAPAIAHLDPSEPNRLHLVVNSESGHLFVYTDLEQPVFTSINDFTEGIREGGRGGIAMADLNTDSHPEMLVGNRRGGLGLFAQLPVESTAIPNPTPKNTSFTFRANWVNKALICLQLPTSASDWPILQWPLSIALIDIRGQILAQTNIENPNDLYGTKYDWHLPKNLPSTGLFFVQIIDRQGHSACTKLVAH